jgi:hypothetical protein
MWIFPVRYVKPFSQLFLAVFPHLRSDVPTLDALAWKLPARQRLALMPQMQQHAVGDGSDGYILKLKMFGYPK